MVIALLPLLELHLLAAAAVEENPVTQPKNLPEPVRQIAYMALLGIALLGLLMIVGTLLGGHWVRRWGNHVRRSVPPDVITPRKETPTAELPNATGNDGETLGGSDTTIA